MLREETIRVEFKRGRNGIFSSKNTSTAESAIESPWNSRAMKCKEQVGTVLSCWDCIILIRLLLRTSTKRGGGW
jgi:hypothetical protein